MAPEHLSSMQIESTSGPFSCNDRFNTTVTLVAGGEKFLVHKKMLEESSEFFAAALSERWAGGEGDTTIDLRDDHPAIVALFIDWVYHGSLDFLDQPLSHEPSPGLRSEALNTLIHLYVFADKVHCSRLKEQIRHKLKSTWDADRLFNIETFARAFMALPETDHLLGDMAGWFTTFGSEENVNDKLLEYAPSLAVACIRIFMKERDAATVEAVKEKRALPEEAKEPRVNPPRTAKEHPRGWSYKIVASK